MKKLLPLLFLTISFVVVLIICVMNENPSDQSDNLNDNSKEEWDKQKKEQQDKEQDKEQGMYGKVVDLAFMGFKLGDPIAECIKKSRGNKEIQNLKISTKSGDKSVEFKSTIDGYQIDCKVCSFQDTITSLVILSSDSDIQGIHKLYTEKYGDGLPPIGNNWEWVFKNGGIKISTHTTSKTRLVPIEGREHLNLRVMSNKYREVTDTYFDMLSITYQNKYQAEKVKKFEKAEQRRADSLSRVEQSKAAEQSKIKQAIEKERSLNQI